MENDGHEENRFTEEQIVGALKQAQAGMAIKELYHQGGFSDATFYKWRSKHGGMQVSDARRLRELGSGNGRLNKLLTASSTALFCSRLL